MSTVSEAQRCRKPGAGRVDSDATMGPAARNRSTICGHGRPADTSEEEEEENLRENFIDDGDSEARFVAVARWPDTFGLLMAAICYSNKSQEDDTMSDPIQEDVSSEDGRNDSQPGQMLYSQSGVVEKRRRMKQLVTQREHKRLRRR